MVTQVKVMSVSDSSRDFCLKSVETLHQFWKDEIAVQPWYDRDKEHCIGVFLDLHNHIRSWNLVSIGSAVSTIINPREVYRPAIVAVAARIAILHNHPSNYLTPSPEDIRACNTLAQTGHIIGIPMEAFIIIADNGIRQIKPQIMGGPTT